MRNYIIFCILTLVGGFVWGTAFGQNFDSTPNTDENIYWAAKPVQCGPVKEMFIEKQHLVD